MRFTRDEINAIKAHPANVAGGPESCLGDMIGKWLHWAPGDARGSKGRATLEALKRAVDKAGYGDVAEKLSLCEGKCEPLDQSEKPDIPGIFKLQG